MQNQQGNKNTRYALGILLLSVLMVAGLITPYLLIGVVITVGLAALMYKLFG